MFLFVPANDGPDRQTRIMKATVLEREITVVKLRAAGHSFEAIAKHVGYSHKSAARKAFERACDRQLGAAVDDYLIANMWDFIGPTAEAGGPMPPNVSTFCEYAAALRMGSDVPPYCTPWRTLVTRWLRDFVHDEPIPGNGASQQVKRQRELAARDERALALYRAGHSFDSIANQLGWGHRSTAWRAVNRALNRHLHAEMSTYLAREVTHLERQYQASWSKALAGSIRNAGTYLSVVDRRDALLAPRPHDVRFQHLPKVVLLRIMTADQWAENLRESRKWNARRSVRKAESRT